ncbi:hypothetical protein BN1708_009272 [Verticillium longisporum]|uniref:Uncharacterized protein n=1 Tax=Verticillium longisporum TaxID=100787 RepID=A0A0G4KGM2_VERLO|nr:hypothetical protein BN1708_009272 [Verticillium longisporum]
MSSSGEMWAIDTTGAQYGFSDILWPEPYTETETWDLDVAIIVEGFGQKLLQGSEEKLQRFLGGVREHIMGFGADAG